MNTKLSIEAALEHAILVRKHLQDARRDPDTYEAREATIALVDTLERLAGR